MVDREGRETPLSVEPGGYRSPRFSPDGDRLSFTIDASELWVYDIDQEIPFLLNRAEGLMHPTWSPDGEGISYTLGGTGLFSLLADGSGSQEPLFDDGQQVWEHELSPDGGWIAYRIDIRPVTDRNIFVAPLDAQDGAPRPYAQSPADEAMLAISPDGRWLAYTSDESGRYEVYVRSFPEPGGPIRVSRDGGAAPRWSPDGTELFYRSANELIAATVETEPGLGITGRQVLFENDYVRSSIYADYDVDPRSGRFVMIKERSLDLVVELHFVERLLDQLVN